MIRDLGGRDLAICRAEALPSLRATTNSSVIRSFSPGRPFARRLVPSGDHDE
jgi:hypothetical protein